MHFFQSNVSAGPVQFLIDLSGQRVDTHFLSVFGASALIFLGIVALVLGIWVFFVLATVFYAQAQMKATRKDETPGAKILVAHFSGVQGGRAKSSVLAALEEHLVRFNFGSSFHCAPCPLAIAASEIALTPVSHARLLRFFKQSGADLIIWGSVGDGNTSALVCMTTPRRLAQEGRRGLVATRISTVVAEWGEIEQQAIAYLAGRRLRPTLGRPADFRAERLYPVTVAMGELLGEKAVMSEDAQNQLQEDFIAGALHIGTQLRNADWLAEARGKAEHALNTASVSDAPIRWARLKIALGRIILAQCRLAFDAQQLDQAMAHLREGIDAVRTDERVQLTQSGFDALAQAEAILADRRKFSVRWNM